MKVMATSYMTIERKAKKQRRIKKVITMAMNSIFTLSISLVIAVLMGGMI